MHQKYLIPQQKQQTQHPPCCTCEHVVQTCETCCRTRQHKHSLLHKPSRLTVTLARCQYIQDPSPLKITRRHNLPDKVNLNGGTQSLQREIQIF